MTNSTLFTICCLINYMVFIECTSQNLYLIQNQSLFNDDQLYFSCDKITFSNFEFIITEKTIQKETIGKRIELCIPIKNFIQTLCMFFLQAKLIDDSDFLKLFENFIEGYYKQEYNCGEGAEVSFDIFLSKQDKFIDAILKEKDPFRQLVRVERKDGRIICKQNNLYNMSIDKKNVYTSYIPVSKSQKVAMDFFLKFYELYLQGFFDTDLFNSLKNLNASYSEKASDPTFPIIEHFDAELFDLYFKLYQDVLDNNAGLQDVCDEYCKNFCKQTLENSLLKFTSLVVEKNISKLIPKRLADSIPKVTAKVFFNVAENLELFFFHSADYVELIEPINNYLKKLFEGKNLSAETIETLVTFCLESYV